MTESESETFCLWPEKLQSLLTGKRPTEFSVEENAGHAAISIGFEITLAANDPAHAEALSFAINANNQAVRFNAQDGHGLREAGKLSYHEDPSGLTIRLHGGHPIA